MIDNMSMLSIGLFILGTACRESFFGIFQSIFNSALSQSRHPHCLYALLSWGDGAALVGVRSFFTPAGSLCPDELHGVNSPAFQIKIFYLLRQAEQF